MIDKQTRQQVLKFQQAEITEYEIYRRLAQKITGDNREVLIQIAADEKRHYDQWKKYTGAELRPERFTVLRYLFIAKIFGLTFAMKMMESGEAEAQLAYQQLTTKIPEANDIYQEEVEHEQLLVDMIDEEKIDYIGSMVLGLNDALVELTGALAGLSFALQNTRTIAVAGFITGIAASLSMSASEYLSQKSEEGSKDPLRASFYTGIAYVITVLLLIFPFFVFASYLTALGVTLFIAVLVIYSFTFFVSVVKNLSFRKLFLEMLIISLGVAGISFIIGLLARKLLSVEI